MDYSGEDRSRESCHYDSSPVFGSLLRSKLRIFRRVFIVFATASVCIFSISSFAFRAFVSQIRSGGVIVQEINEKPLYFEYGLVEQGRLSGRTLDYIILSTDKLPEGMEQEWNDGIRTVNEKDGLAIPLEVLHGKITVVDEGVPESYSAILRVEDLSQLIKKYVDAKVLADSLPHHVDVSDDFALNLRQFIKSSCPQLLERFDQSYIFPVVKPGRGGEELEESGERSQ